MAFSTLLLRTGLFACVLLSGQLSAHAQANAEPDEWTPAERAEMQAYEKAHKAEFEADSIREAEYMREEIKGRYILSDTTVYTVEAIDQLPAQPGGGGAQAIAQAIRKAFRYPALALRKGRQGTAVVSFVVDENGEITNAKVTKGLGYGIDEEILNAVNRLPKFLPAKCSGQYVRVGLVLPIVLSMN